MFIKKLNIFLGARDADSTNIFLNFYRPLSSGIIAKSFQQKKKTMDFQSRDIKFFPNIKRFIYNN